MRDYSRVSPKFWTGGTGKALRQLGPECQVLALYLMTSPQANMIGLYYLPITYMAHETGLGSERTRKALASLIEAGFCGYDDDAEVVWVYEMTRHQLGDSKPGDKQRVGSAKQYAAAPSCTHLEPFFDKYKEELPLNEHKNKAFKPRIEGLAKALARPSTDEKRPTDTRDERSDEQSDEQRDDRRSSDSLTSGDLFAEMNQWGGRWVPAIRSKSDADRLAKDLTPFTSAEVQAAKAEAERLDGSLGYHLLLKKIQHARQGKRSPPRDARVGYHPGGKPEDFPDGIVDLNTIAG